MRVQTGARVAASGENLKIERVNCRGGSFAIEDAIAELWRGSRQRQQVSAAARGAGGQVLESAQANTDARVDTKRQVGRIGTMERIACPRDLEAEITKINSQASSYREQSLTAAEFKADLDRSRSKDLGQEGHRHRIVRVSIQLSSRRVWRRRRLDLASSDEFLMSSMARFNLQAAGSRSGCRRTDAANSQFAAQIADDGVESLVNQPTHPRLERHREGCGEGECVA